MTDCYALVVREEFWDRQLRIYTQLCNIKLDKKQIDRIAIVIVELAKKAGEAAARLLELLRECFEKAWVCIKDNIADTLEAMKKFVDECKITLDDDFGTICDKLENRMLYLNRQEHIRSEQYYKSQFRLAKINYNVLHHDRRC